MRLKPLGPVAIVTTTSYKVNKIVNEGVCDVESDNKNKDMKSLREQTESKGN